MIRSPMPREALSFDELIKPYLIMDAKRNEWQSQLDTLSEQAEYFKDKINQSQNPKEYELYNEFMADYNDAVDALSNGYNREVATKLSKLKKDYASKIAPLKTSNEIYTKAMEERNLIIAKDPSVRFPNRINPLSFTNGEIPELNYMSGDSLRNTFAAKTQAAAQQILGDVQTSNDIDGYITVSMQNGFSADDIANGLTQGIQATNPVFRQYNQEIEDLIKDYSEEDKAFLRSKAQEGFYAGLLPQIRERVVDNVRMQNLRNQFRNTNVPKNFSGIMMDSDGEQHYYYKGNKLIEINSDEYPELNGYLTNGTDVIGYTKDGNLQLIGKLSDYKAKTPQQIKEENTNTQAENKHTGSHPIKNIWHGDNENPVEDNDKTDKGKISKDIKPYEIGFIKRESNDVIFDENVFDTEAKDKTERKNNKIKDKVKNNFKSNVFNNEIRQNILSYLNNNKLNGYVVVRVVPYKNGNQYIFEYIGTQKNSGNEELTEQQKADNLKSLGTAGAFLSAAIQQAQNQSQSIGPTAW